MTSGATSGRRERRRGACGEDGAATVLVLALVGVLLVGTWATVALGRAAAARHRAAAAADLAALAAAGMAWGAAPPGACTGEVLAVASRSATANGGRLTGCVVLAGDDVRVDVAVPLTGVAGFDGPARASARAGPAP